VDLIVVELLVVLGVALGIGLWQLRDINRELRKDRDKPSQADDEQD